MDWDHKAPVEMVHWATMEHAEFPGQQLVVLSQVLAHELTLGYERLENVLLWTVNGTRVRNLRHVRELIDACTEGYLRFAVQQNLMLILKAEDAKRGTPEVLNKYCISAP